jgi:hypothetical protein
MFDAAVIREIVCFEIANNAMAFASSVPESLTVTTFADLQIVETGQAGWKEYAELMLRHQFRTCEPRETDAAHDIYGSHGTYNREADSMGEWADMVAIRLTAGLLDRDFGRRIALYKPVYNEQHAVTGFLFHEVVQPLRIGGDDVVAAVPADEFVPRVDDVALLYYDGTHFDVLEMLYRSGVSEEDLHQVGRMVGGQQ